MHFRKGNAVSNSWNNTCTAKQTLPAAVQKPSSRGGRNTAEQEVIALSQVKGSSEGFQSPLECACNPATQARNSISPTLFPRGEVKTPCWSTWNRQSSLPHSHSLSPPPPGPSHAGYSKPLKNLSQDTLLKHMEQTVLTSPFPQSLTSTSRALPRSLLKIPQEFISRRPIKMTLDLISLKGVCHQLSSEIQ